MEREERGSDKCEGMAVPECLADSSRVIERMINGLNFSVGRVRAKIGRYRIRRKRVRNFLIANCRLSSTRPTA